MEGNCERDAGLLCRWVKSFPILTRISCHLTPQVAKLCLPSTLYTLILKVGLTGNYSPITFSRDWSNSTVNSFLKLILLIVICIFHLAKQHQMVNSRHKRCCCYIDVNKTTSLIGKHRIIVLSYHMCSPRRAPTMSLIPTDEPKLIGFTTAHRRFTKPTVNNWNAPSVFRRSLCVSMTCRHCEGWIYFNPWPLQNV